MGGDFYEREVYVAPASSNQQSSSSSNSYSDQASKALNQVGLHKSNDPKRFAEEDRQLVCAKKNPIVFALDVSGSMGDWPKVTLIYKTCLKFNRSFTINSPCFMVR